MNIAWTRLNIYIIIRLYESVLKGEKITKRQIAREFFQDIDEIKKFYLGNSSRYLNAKENTVNRSFITLKKRGYILVDEKNGETNFIPNKEKVKIIKSKLIDNKLKTFLCVKMVYDKGVEKWDCFEI